MVVSQNQVAGPHLNVSKPNYRNFIFYDGVSIVNRNILAVRTSVQIPEIVWLSNVLDLLGVSALSSYITKSL